MASGRKSIKITLILITVIAGVTAFSAYPDQVEKYFTCGTYPVTSAIQRFLFGWIPFSIGDVIYIVFIFGGIYLLISNIIKIFRGKIPFKMFLLKLAGLVIILLGIYALFMLAWGLNYNRDGIAFQLQIDRPHYDTTDLLALQKMAVDEVNKSRTEFEEAGAHYPSNRQLFKESVQAYKDVSEKFPFLRYLFPSVKSSMFGRIFNYFGFVGYYNPFTGEAQVNSSVPRFLIPSITVHEMGHQIGYAKEDEASFSGFLAGSHSPDPLFRYSSWLDIFIYVNNEVGYFNVDAAMAADSSLNALVHNDLDEWRQFNMDHRSFIEPASYWVYGNYLKFNGQLRGMRSYDDVVALAIAYFKKAGKI